MPLVSAAEELQRILTSLLGRWSELKSKDISSINGQLKQANQPVLSP
jgi:hypothetical protein